MFEKVFLDPRYMESFHKIALQENFVREGGEFSDISGKHIDFALSSKKNSLRKKTLQYLTLFEEIDGIASPLNLSALVECGLIQGNSTIITGIQSQNESKQIRNISSDITQLVLNEYREKIIDQHLTRFSQGRHSSNKLSLLNHRERQQTLELYERCKARVIQEFTQYEIDDDLTAEQSNLYEELSNTSLGLHDALCSSLSEGAQIVSPYVSCIQDKNRFQESFEDLACIAQVMLREEVNILPAPKNLQDVIQMRKSEELVRFREVVSEWLEVIQDGQVNAESKIRRDIQKANKELKRLKSWEERKNSKLAFWVNAIGGHVPIFSNVLTFVSTFGDKGYTKWVKKNSGWAMILK